MNLNNNGHTVCAFLSFVDTVEVVWLASRHIQFFRVSVRTVGWSHSGQLWQQSVPIGWKAVCQETPSLTLRVCFQPLITSGSFNTKMN